LIFSRSSGCFVVSSLIENERMVIRTVSFFTTAVAILFDEFPNKAISQIISSAIIVPSLVELHLIIFEISISHSFRKYIAFASSHSLKRISHGDTNFS